MIRLSTSFNDMSKLPEVKGSRLCKVAICIPKTAARKAGYFILPAIWDGEKFTWKETEVLKLNMLKLNMTIDMKKNMSENPYIIGWELLINATSELIDEE